jgi:hypothetical protein
MSPQDVRITRRHESCRRVLYLRLHGASCEHRPAVPARAGIGSGCCSGASFAARGQRCAAARAGDVWHRSSSASSGLNGRNGRSLVGGGGVPAALVVAERTPGRIHRAGVLESHSPREGGAAVAAPCQPQAPRPASRSYPVVSAAAARSGVRGLITRPVTRGEGSRDDRNTGCCAEEQRFAGGGAGRRTRVGPVRPASRGLSVTGPDGC